MMMISKDPNLTDYSEEDDSLSTLDHRCFCNLWISSRKYLKLSTTTTSSDIQRKNPNFTDSKDDLLPTPIQFRCVCKFWKSIHKFARKHFKRSTRSDTSSTNPNIIIERSDISSTNPNICIDSLPILPFDLITEILSRLPVKLLLQLRSVCKSWNSLISNDPNFARKHLTHSTTTHSICSLGFTYPGYLSIYPPNFFFDTSVSTHVIELCNRSYNCFRCNRAKEIVGSCNCNPAKEIVGTCYCIRTRVKEIVGYCNCITFKEIVGSCNGILLIAYKEFIKLWNPSINKLKELPILPKPHYREMTYGFGYDSVTHHYKVVLVLWNYEKAQVKVNTLGTKTWKNIEEFPFGFVPDHKSGKYVNGTINWLASSQHYSSPRIIVSLDLGNESYQEVLQPDYGEVNANSSLILDVSRDCLCIISGHDIWLMKEYGKKESWTKLFTISYKQDPSMRYFLKKVIYVFEDGQVLLQMKMPFILLPQLIVYDPRIGTFNFVTFPKSFYSRSVVLDVSKYGGLVVCMESLISP